ncbi:MAG: hypothetical protein U5R30_13770 [Deltaproteobacteria bacterium]|nr:hypothetical protein [Deltaproteobacteria bacterium]
MSFDKNFPAGCQVGAGKEKALEKTDEKGIAKIRLEKPGLQVLIAIHNVPVEGRSDDEPAMSIWELETIKSRSLPAGYAAEKDGVMLISTGKIHQAMEGCACPMGSVSREFLKKFQTGDEEVLIADMEAGIEHFGRGLEAGVNGVVSVVEPSLESILLAKKVMDLAQSAGTAFYGAILNKFSSKEQENQVVGRLNAAGVPLIGSIGFQDALQTACLAGKPLADLTPSMDLKGLVDILLQKQEGEQKA